MNLVESYEVGPENSPETGESEGLVAQGDATSRPEAIGAIALRVAEINLRPVTDFCVQCLGWSRARAERVEIDYRRFLALHLLEPGEKLVANLDVDEYWHMHILHTHLYFAHCEHVFGHYLHHNPEVLQSRDDIAPYAAYSSTTERLFIAYFGQPPSNGETHA